MAIITPLTYTIANGQAVDATPLMADLNQIVNNVNANAAAINGSSTQVFSVALSTAGTAEAVPRSQADALYAPASGNTGYVSSVSLAASGGAGIVGYSQGASGSVLRTQAAKNQESVSVLDFGADPTGATDSTAAITNALSVVPSVFSPYGNYKTSFATGNAFNGVLHGLGRMNTADGNKHAPFFGALQSAPSSQGNWNSLDECWNGDLSHVQFAVEHRIIGAATLGNPSTGYAYMQEASTFLESFYNASGVNNNTTTNDGRTMASHRYAKIEQNGQGDCAAFVVQGIIASANLHTTSWLTAPAISTIVSDLYASAAGQYLNPFENHLTDNGFDVAAVGYETALFRHFSGSATLGNSWVGFIVQSQGSAPIDAAYTAQGLVKIGLDFTQLSLPTSGAYLDAAIVLAGNQRIYGGGSTTPAGTNALFTSNPNTDFFYDAPGVGWVFAVGNSGQLVIGNGQVTVVHTFAHDGAAVGFFGATPVGRVPGWGTPVGNSVVANFNGSSATLAQCSSVIAQLIVYFKQLGFFIP